MVTNIIHRRFTQLLTVRIVKNIVLYLKAESQLLPKPAKMCSLIPCGTYTDSSGFSACSKKRRATERERKELIERIGNHDIDWELESDIKSLVLRYDGVGYCRQQLDKHRKEAQVALTVFHPITRVHESLLSLLHFTIARNY